jgi:VWFA-related protein
MQLQKSITLSLVLLLTLLVGLPGAAMAQQTSPDLSVHYVEGRPQSGQYAYDVDIYFSAFRAGGDPVRDLQPGDLVITEDGKRVEITSLNLADKDPISIVVVMDTSGSMRGVKMDAARSAASRFISGLGSDDLAAVMSFDSQVRTEIGFTDKLSDAREKLDLLDATAGAGTCLYDALYESITLTATIPTGRRAIVILTDGVDELADGRICSKYREEDVISLAKSGSTRVPIYTVGLGGKVDSAGLQRIADSTGGRYQFASDEQKLQDLFTGLLEQLRSQYKVTYVSTAAPGPHQLVLEATVSGQQLRKLREFVLPNFSYNLVMVSPKDGESVSGKIKLGIQVIGQGEPISKVEFFANGESIGVVESMPYELEWEIPETLSGEANIEAGAFNANGVELARTAIRVAVTSSSDETLLPGETEIAPPADGETAVDSSFPTIMIAAVIGLLVVVIVAVVIFLTLRRKKKEQEKEKERELLWQQKVQGVGAAEQAFGSEDRTFDAFVVGEGVHGMLVVLQSDDPVMIGQRFEITRSSTRLGRKADNDILFPKDSPVSRYHAVIDERNGGLFLSEIFATEDGSPKRPAFGTFVNDRQIEDQVLLQSGDEIRLGKRVRLRFEGKDQTMDDDGNTRDMFMVDDEKTRDDL